MTTYNTNNPLGSTDPRDLYDNSQNLDHLVNDQVNESWADRFGNQRMTWRGIEVMNQNAIAGYGWILVDSFQAGITLTLPNQALRDTSTGEYYRWGGTFPKVVPPGSTPLSAGGIGPNAWVGVGDASLRTALAAISGAGLVGLSVGTTYPPNTVGSAIQYRTPQMYGIEPSNTAAIGSGLDAMFAAGGDIRFEKPGVYLASKTWVLRSGTRLYIGPGVTIRLAPNAGCNIFQNYAYANNSLTKDALIEIYGSGTIDYDYSNQTASGLNRMVSVFKSVNTLNIGGGLKVTNGLKYAWLIANVTNLTADGLIFDTPSDGLHLQPPVTNAYIRNLMGYTGDDMTSFTIGDYAGYDISEPGDFSNIDIAGIYCGGSLRAVKMTGNSTGNFVRFKVSGIYGTTTASIIRVCNDSNLLKTVVKSLSIDNIFCVPPAATPSIEVTDAGHGTGTDAYAVEVDTLTCEKIFSGNTTSSVVYVGGNGTYGTIVHNLIVKEPPRDAYIIVNLDVATGVTIDNLLISDGNIQFQDNTNCAVVSNRGTITNLTIENIKAVFPSTSNGSIARMIAAAKVETASFKDVTQVRGQRGWNNVTSAMSGSTELNLVNYTCSGDGRIAQITGSTLTVRMSNCRRVNDSGAQTAFFASGGTITLSGSLETGYNTIGVNSGGVIKTTAGIHNIPCDLTVLTSVDGSSVINTNTGLACGGGRVLVNASKIWKHLYTGATYTSSL